MTLESSPPPRAPRLSAELLGLSARCGQETVTLRLLLPGLTPRDHGLCTLFISLCFLHPFPMVGISTILGAVIMIAGGRMAWGLGPWIPKRFLDRPLPGRLLAKVLSLAAQAMSKLERLTRPRGLIFARHAWVWRLNGMAVAACGLLIALPLPPPTNFPPALALLLLSIGILEEDSLFLGLGYLAFVLNVLLFGAIAVLGVSGVRALLA